MKTLSLTQMETINGGWFSRFRGSNNTSSNNSSSNSTSEPKEDKTIQVKPGTGDITVSCCNFGVIKVDVVEVTISGQAVFDSWSNAVLENAEAGHGLVSPAN